MFYIVAEIYATFQRFVSSICVLIIIVTTSFCKIFSFVCVLGANVSITDFDGLTVLDHAMYDQKYEITGTDGEIYVWGSNTNYTLGPQQARTVPEIMDIFHKENPSAQVKQVCLSRFHCVILTSDGKIFTSGHGQGGRLGLSTEHAVLTPKEIKFSANSCSSVVFVMASIAQDHSIFLADSGHVKSKVYDRNRYFI